MGLNKKIILCILLALPTFVFGQEDAAFSNLQWQSDLHEAIDEANIDDTVVISFDAQNIPDGSSVDVEIWEETDGKLTDFIAGLQGTVVNGSVELEWVVKLDMDNKDANYVREIEENYYTIIDYVFVVKYDNTTISSQSLAILAWASYNLVDALTKEPLRNEDFILMAPDGKFMIERTDDKGRAVVRNLRKIGYYTVIR